MTRREHHGPRAHPYFKRYPKIVRAKRIVLPIATVLLVCLVTN